MSKLSTIIESMSKSILSIRSELSFSEVQDYLEETGVVGILRKTFSKKSRTSEIVDDYLDGKLIILNPQLVKGINNKEFTKEYKDFQEELVTMNVVIENDDYSIIEHEGIQILLFIDNDDNPVMIINNANIKKHAKRDVATEWKEHIASFLKDQVDANQLDMIIDELVSAKDDKKEIKKVLDTYNIDMNESEIHKLQGKLKVRIQSESDDRKLSDIVSSLNTFIETNPEDAKYELFKSNAEHYIERYGDLSVDDCIKAIEADVESAESDELGKFNMFLGNVKFLSKTFTNLQANLKKDFKQEDYAKIVVETFPEYTVELLEFIGNFKVFKSYPSSGMTEYYLKALKSFNKKEIDSLNYLFQDEFFERASNKVIAFVSNDEFEIDSYNADYLIGLVNTLNPSLKKHSMGDITPEEWAGMYQATNQDEVLAPIELDPVEVAEQSTTADFLDDKGTNTGLSMYADEEGKKSLKDAIDSKYQFTSYPSGIVVIWNKDGKDLSLKELQKIKSTINTETDELVDELDLLNTKIGYFEVEGGLEVKAQAKVTDTILGQVTITDTFLQCHEGETHAGGKISKVLEDGNVEVEMEDGTKKTVKYADHAEESNFKDWLKAFFDTADNDLITIKDVLGNSDHNLPDKVKLELLGEFCDSIGYELTKKAIIKKHSSKSEFLYSKLIRLKNSLNPLLDLKNDRALSELNDDQYLSLLNILDLIKSGNLTGNDMEHLTNTSEFINNVNNPYGAYVDALKVGTRNFALSKISLTELSEALSSSYGEMIKSIELQDNVIVVSATELFDESKISNYILNNYSLSPTIIKESDIKYIVDFNLIDEVVTDFNIESSDTDLAYFEV